MNFLGKAFKKHEPRDSSPAYYSNKIELDKYGVMGAKRSEFSKVVGFIGSVILCLFLAMFGPIGWVIGILAVIMSLVWSGNGRVGGWYGKCPGCNKDLMVSDPNQSALLIAPIRLACPKCNTLLEVAEHHFFVCAPVSRSQ